MSMKIGQQYGKGDRGKCRMKEDGHIPRVNECVMTDTWWNSARRHRLS